MTERAEVKGLDGLLKSSILISEASKFRATSTTTLISRKPFYTIRYVQPSAGHTSRSRCLPRAASSEEIRRRLQFYCHSFSRRVVRCGLITKLATARALSTVVAASCQVDGPATPGVQKNCSAARARRQGGDPHGALTAEQRSLLLFLVRAGAGGTAAGRAAAPPPASPLQRPRSSGFSSNVAPDIRVIFSCNKDNRRVSNCPNDRVVHR